ncbi:MAG: hypothetical protein GY940_37785 [bacterium]|nr:hypothetical protein [bacterium]
MPKKDLIIVNCNMLEFDASTFLPLTPIPPMAKWIITASGQSMAGGLPVCIDGDESSVVKPHGYNTSSFPIPGAGNFEITALGGDQTAPNTEDSNKPVIIKGSVFDAKFTVNSKAKLPTPKGPEEDPMATYTGKGKFVNPFNKNVYAG